MRSGSPGKHFLSFGPSLDVDPVEQRIINDEEANDMLTRDYRKPFVVPEKV